MSVGFAVFRSSAPLTDGHAGVLQRKCDCEGSEHECEDCKKRGRLQRYASSGAGTTLVPPSVSNVVQSQGRSLDSETRTDMERRFGHDFGRVRVHTDAAASESARSVSALAYTVGPNIVFAAGQYAPNTRTGRRLLAHELTHVVQQRRGVGGEPRPQRYVERLAGGGYRLTVAPIVADEPQSLEREADSTAERVINDSPTAGGHELPTLSASTTGTQVQRVRVPLPSNVALCGKTLTHLDIEPPRWRPLEPCQAPTVLVNRINIVGRDLTAPTPGKGRQVFNLHIGYYHDAATGRLCVIADDSKTCIAPRCLSLGCFPTMREVLDAIVEFLKTALVVLGVIALAIIIALIIDLLGPILVPAVASNQDGDNSIAPGRAPTSAEALAEASA